MPGPHPTSISIELLIEKDNGIAGETGNSVIVMFSARSAKDTVQ